MKFDPDDHAKEVYAHFGLAIYLAQVLEHGLVVALIYADLMPSRKPHHTTADFDLFMDRHFETTMGQLIKAVQKHVPVPAELKVLLLEARAKRNWLVHHYFRERAESFMNEPGREKMIAELKKAHGLFSRTDELLGEVVRPLREKFGFTDKKLEADYNAYAYKIGADL
jgi:hypothetical protein